MDATENNATQGAPAAERTFTQSEMDAIIGDRLKRERSKYSNYEELQQKAAQFDTAQEASKSELERATERARELQAELDAIKTAKEIADIKADVAKSAGIDAAILRGSTREELEEHAAALVSAIGAIPRFPDVFDGGSASSPTVTKDEIMSIRNGAERIRQMAAHPELFQ